MYFDDLKITHTHSPIVAGADFYPFGLAMDGREIKDEHYRWGYQGQYAEKDTITGLNEFQLRMYDARFGRFTTTDPYKEFHSPYVAMGNRPHMITDPTGGFTGATLLNEVVVTASRLPSVGSIIGGIAGSVGKSLMTNAIAGPNDWYVPKGTKGYTKKAQWFDEDPGDEWEWASSDRNHTFNNFDYSQGLSEIEGEITIFGRRPLDNTIRFARLGANLITGLLLVGSGSEVAAPVIAAAPSIASSIALEANAISTYYYVLANQKRIVAGGAISAGIAKPILDMLRSPQVRLFRIHHSWSRTPLQGAQKGMENFNILPSRGTPFIPRDRPPGIMHFLDLWKTTH